MRTNKKIVQGRFNVCTTNKKNYRVLGGGEKKNGVKKIVLGDDHEQSEVKKKKEENYGTVLCCSPIGAL